MKKGDWSGSPSRSPQNSTNPELSLRRRRAAPEKDENNSDRVAPSGSDFLEPVVVVKTGEYGNRCDAVALGQAVTIRAGWRWELAVRFRKTRP
jgi:hypothetical protein